ncbi:MAG: type IX secretion system membrane protein PorP/SprF [Bacteroidales bacterium]|nr:type IX secretion system membrane protein PorP/SprF [Bacteroidales bacterium]
MLTAQQLPVYSQYMFNGYLINPAVAGSEGYTIINLSAREEWLGFPNSPKTHSLSVQTRLFRKKYSIVHGKGSSSRYRKGRSGRVGLGGYLFSDQNGLTNRTGGEFAYAYHISFTNTHLSFGLAATVMQFSMNTSEFRPKQSETFERITYYMPDANFGMLLRRFGYYAGISVAHLLETPLILGSNVSSYHKTYKTARHYNFWTGQQFETTNSGLKYEPSLMIRASENLSLQIDANVKFIVNDMYWAGVSLRSNKSTILLLGAKKGIVHMAYSFDYTFNSIRKRTFGSHELMVSIKLGDPTRRYRWMKRY